MRGDSKAPAILGGSFDPIHIGHLHLADAALHSGLFDVVYFVPAYRSPHKRNGAVASDTARKEMVEAAVEHREHMHVLNWELERMGTSYTVDTVRGVRATLSEDMAPGLILGDDLLDGFERWKHMDELVLTTVLTIGARDSDDPREDPRIAKLEALGGTVRVLSNAVLPVSSSDIRRRIEDGEAYRDLVPVEVYDIIERRTLYR